MSWLSGAVGAIGNIAGGIFSASSARKAAADNRRWQEYMSNTAHQREVEDLRAAGLNPILSATGGQGASTPSGGVAHMPDMSSLGSDAMASWHSAKMAKLERDRIAKEVELARSQIRNDGRRVENETRQTDSNIDIAKLNYFLGRDVHQLTKDNILFQQNIASAQLADALLTGRAHRSMLGAQALNFVNMAGYHSAKAVSERYGHDRHKFDSEMHKSPFYLAPKAIGETLKALNPFISLFGLFRR